MISQLPTFLQLRTDGAIVIDGHRVTLFAILQAMAELKSDHTAVTAITLGERFPTVPTGTLADVLEYIAQHPAETSEYFESQLAISQSNSTQFPYKGPSLTELRQRRNGSH